MNLFSKVEFFKPSLYALYQYKNDNQKIILSVKLHKLCTDVGLRCKQIIACLTHLSATETSNAYTMLRFFMIIAEVKLFYAVTLDWEISLSYKSLYQLYNLLHSITCYTV